MAEKITIALHTRSHAERLVALLMAEGVKAEIIAVDFPRKITDVPVGVSIDVDDVPTTLRIIENLEIFSLDHDDKAPLTKSRKSARDILFGNKKSAGKNNRRVILLPVDFSDYSFLAARFAFPLAHKHKASIVLLHAYVLPSRTDNLSFSPDTMAFEPQDMELDITLEETAKSQMRNFTDKIRQYIKEGIIPPVKFTSEILEGLPETVINDYARDTNPTLIVMGTRGANKKERELVGSITAEVLDTCRYPVFTVPETNKSTIVGTDLREVAFFCNLDNDDITALNTLHSVFPEEQFHITFIHILSARDRIRLVSSDDTLKKLRQYCKTKFRGYTFSAKDMTPDELKEALSSQTLPGINFIVIPNKRRHAIARLFNPSLAHRLLFHADIPMMVVPV